jgi:hypothetical protein
MAIEGRQVEGLSPGLLAAALEAARERSEEVDRRVNGLLHEREVVRREVELLEELLAVRQGNLAGRTTVSSVGPEPDSAGGATRTRARQPHSAVTATIAELERAGHPLHISELMRLLEERDVKIPGSGQQANLIAHLTRSPAVVRPSRGMYGLTAWGLENKARLKPAKRRRVRGQSKSKSGREE